jgi:phosphotriesterase-related protein
MQRDEETIAGHFQTEIEQGVEATGIQAGLIKVASPARWNDETEKIFVAAALAHRATGCPSLTHTEEGRLAEVQCQLFMREKVDCSHVVLSHLDRNPDVEYHRQVLRTGVTIEYDSHFRWKNKLPNPTLELLKTLLPEFPDQIVLGMDAARRSYWKSYGGGPGLAYLFTDFKNQMLEAGIGEELIYKVFVTTPARVYRFKEKA